MHLLSYGLDRLSYNLASLLLYELRRRFGLVHVWVPGADSLSRVSLLNVPERAFWMALWGTCHASSRESRYVSLPVQLPSLDTIKQCSRLGEWWLCRRALEGACALDISISAISRF